jgi:hypothetical protein
LRTIAPSEVDQYRQRTRWSVHINYLPVVLRVDNLAELLAREHEGDNVFKTVQITEDRALRIIAALNQGTNTIVAIAVICSDWVA